MDRLECDRMFVAVMETGSFTGAAGKLGNEFRAGVETGFAPGGGVGCTAV